MSPAVKIFHAGILNSRESQTLKSTLPSTHRLTYNMSPTLNDSRGAGTTAPSPNDMHGEGRILHLPDTLVSWPWPRTINPHYEDCKRESSAWAESFHAFGPKAQAAFNKCDFSRSRSSKQRISSPTYTRIYLDLLASLAYASLDRGKIQSLAIYLGHTAYADLHSAGCRVGCDLMNLFFIFDEWSDVSSAHETRVQADVIMAALREPHKPRPSDEWVGGEVTRQYAHPLLLSPSVNIAAGSG